MLEEALAAAQTANQKVLTIQRKAAAAAEKERRAAETSAAAPKSARHMARNRSASASGVDPGPRPTGVPRCHRLGASGRLADRAPERSRGQARGSRKRRWQ